MKDHAPGTENRPLRVAIIGSGPSGFYAAESILREANLTVSVDMFDRLPTP
jgi:ferredoxin--NADP+ reductase